MANYYYIKIKSENLTQQVAAEIYNFLADKCLIRHFSYTEGGTIFYNTRGFHDINEILTKYNIQENEVNIEDEFERFYNTLDAE